MEGSERTPRRGHRWVDHTAELELEIEAPTQAAVFEEALLALRELLDGAGGKAAVEEVAVRASDQATLLAEWLAELAFLAETKGLVAERLAALELGEGRLCATVEGRLGAPPHLVKAVTYHRLALRRAGEGWRATVVLDV